MLLTLAVISLIITAVWFGLTRSWPMMFLALGLLLEALAKHGLHINL